MKKFRLFGMALVAVLMGISLASCEKENVPEGGENQGGNGNGNEQQKEEVVVEKRLVKIDGLSSDGADAEIYTFEYDDKGRVIKAIEEVSYGNDSYTNKDEYSFIWGDNAIKVTENGDSYTLTLKDGLVVNDDNGDKYTYSESGRFIKGSNDEVGGSTTVIWDGDKLMSVTSVDSYNEEYYWDATFTYQSQQCKYGYFPFAALMIDFGPDPLFLANPEVAGMRTTQLPTKRSTKYSDAYQMEEEDILSFKYELDEKGDYVSKVIVESSSGTKFTYTLTWK